MENIPATLQALALKGFSVSPSDRDTTVAGLVLYRADAGEFHVIATRQQLLDISEECTRAAQAMPKPS